MHTKRLQLLKFTHQLECVTVDVYKYTFTIETFINTNILDAPTWVKKITLKDKIKN